MADITKDLERALSGPNPPPAPEQAPHPLPQPEKKDEGPVLPAAVSEQKHEVEDQSPALREFWVALLSDLEPAHASLEPFAGVKHEAQPVQQSQPQPQAEPQPQAQQSQTVSSQSVDESEKWFKYLPWILGGLLVLGGLALWFKGKFGRGEDHFGGGGRPVEPEPVSPSANERPQQEYDGDYYKQILTSLYGK